MGSFEKEDPMVFQYFKSFYRMFLCFFTMVKMFSFGKRKIMGMNYTRYIALPKDWLRHQELDSNDEVKIELTKDGDLLIKAMKREARL